MANRFNVVRSKWYDGIVGDDERLAAIQEAQMAQSPGKALVLPNDARYGRQQRQDEAGHPLECFVDSISGFMDERIVHTLGLVVQVAGADDKPVETRRNRTRSSGVGSR